MVQPEIKPGVSVLICTYNGSQRLHQTLNAFKDQINTENIHWEVLLIDNASTDNTSEVAEKLLKDSNITYTLLHEPRPGKTNAIESGFGKAQYEYVCIVDDDNWVCRDYVYKVFHVMFNHPDVAVCGAKGEGVFEEDPPSWFKYIETAYGIGPQGKGDGYLGPSRDCLYGASSVIRKTYWEELKKAGFKFNLSGRKGESLSSGEDNELCQAMVLRGHKLWYSPSITFKHYMPASRINLPYLIRLMKAFGRYDVIAYQYRIYENRYNYIKRLVLSTYFLHIMYYVYRLIRSIPLKSLLFFQKDRYDKKIMHFIRTRSYLIELLHSRKKIKEIRTNIQKLRKC
ncbi:MAG: glycosyltransferase [Bacteroidales bacterium]|nr:glycosyltransferase [Bacteroidales bacterium]